MKAVKFYGYGQIWCRRGASWCICHGSMSNALPFCWSFDHTGRLCCSSDQASLLNVGRGCSVDCDVGNVGASLTVYAQHATVLIVREPRCD